MPAGIHGGRGLYYHPGSDIYRLHGHTYIMGNAQHIGDFSKNIDPTLKSQIELLINKFEAPIGYLKGVPKP